MINMAIVCDPLRTIDAGKLYGIVHTVAFTKQGFMTACGFEIDQNNLLILRQRLEDITCPKCKEHLLDSSRQYDTIKV